MLALLLAAAFPPAESLELWRGANLGDHRYWAVEDTTLDSTEPDAYQGGYATLNGGPGKVILIKFGDLRRTLGPGCTITSASLVLTPSVAQQAKLAKVAIVNVPWNEGPSYSRGGGATTDGAAPRSATWNQRRAGREAVAWEQPGANGPADTSPLDGVTSTSTTDNITITGLGPAIQSQYDKPWNANGIALWFEQEAEFWSSSSKEERPKLVLTFDRATPADGPDLSVVLISRTPEFDRYDVKGPGTAKDQDGIPVAVPDAPSNGTTQKWPIENAPLTYTATVKNVGSAPAAGFSAQWVVGERPRPPATIDKALAPGEQTTLTIENPYRNIHSDHRLQPIELRIIPTGKDAIAANDSLTIQEGALNFGIYVEQALYESFKQKANFIGSKSFEDWIQGVFGVWNDAIMPYSRFSFAPDGALERCRIQALKVVPDGTLSVNGLAPLREPNLAFDAEFALAGPWVDPGRVSFDLIRALSHEVGLVDLDSMVAAADDPQVAALGAPRSADVYPGLMGGGDTRNEGLWPAILPLPYTPVADPLLQAMYMEPTDLYSATDVAALNSTLGRRRGYMGEYLYDVPPAFLITVMDGMGRRIPNASLEFYQTAGGRLPKDPRVRVRTSDTGTVAIQSRIIQESQPVNTFTGHTLKANPFGRIDRFGANGLMLVKVTTSGGTDWCWLKLWQAVDAYHRGSQAVASLTLRVNLPSQPLDLTTNYATGREVRGPDQNTATLSALIDGNEATTAELPSGDGAFVELDLGRDRPVGEIRLVAIKGAPMWQSFDIQVRGTGQAPEQATLWGGETNWRWMAVNRNVSKTEAAAVAYRGVALRMRYIRIVPKNPAPGQLAEIAVAGILQP